MTADMRVVSARDWKYRIHPLFNQVLIYAAKYKICLFMLIIVLNTQFGILNVYIEILCGDSPVGERRVLNWEFYELDACGGIYSQQRIKLFGYF